jgi:hypothetical protein
MVALALGGGEGGGTSLILVFLIYASYNNKKV